MTSSAEDFDRGLQRLWWDTHVGGGKALELLIATVGTERLVLGTNLAGWDSPGELVDEVPAELIPTLTANARCLLGA